jgi:hypothetical protein
MSNCRTKPLKRARNGIAAPLRSYSRGVGTAAASQVGDAVVAKIVS